MEARLDAAQIWKRLKSQVFGVVGFVTAVGEARTAGIAYMVRDKKIYFCTETNAWKTKHLRNNAHISMTVPVPKRVFFMPWAQIPPATITFSGTARVLTLSEAPSEVPDVLLAPLEPKDELMRSTSVIEVTPKGDFVTYGIGVSLKTMTKPKEAGRRVAVA